HARAGQNANAASVSATATDSQAAAARLSERSEARGTSGASIALGLALMATLRSQTQLAPAMMPAMEQPPLRAEVRFPSAGHAGIARYLRVTRRWRRRP